MYMHIVLNPNNGKPDTVETYIIFYITKNKNKLRKKHKTKHNMYLQLVSFALNVPL